MERKRVLVSGVLPVLTLSALASAGQAQVQLSGPMARPWGRFHEALLAPSGARVAYAAEQELYGVAELFTAPTDGSAPPVKVSGAHVGGEYARMLFTPDSSRLVYVLDGLGSLMSTPADGSGAPVQLASIGCANCDDSDFAFTLTPEGSHVLYRDERHDHHPLYAVPVDGSAAAVAISLPDAWYVPFFAGSLDGTRVVFVELEGFAYHLWSRPIDASAPAQRLDPGLLHVDGTPLLTADGLAVFLADDEPQYDGTRLYVAPLDGSTPPLELNGPLVGGGNVQTFALAEGGTSVVYRADALEDGRDELFVVPLDGSAAPRRLSHALAPEGDVLNFALTADGGLTLYLALESGITQLWSVRVDGPWRAVRLNGPLAPGGNVTSFQLAEPAAGGARIVYRADAHVDGQLELYSAPLRSPRPHLLPAGVPRATRLGVVAASHWTVAADGAHVLWLADSDENGLAELRSIPVRGGTPVRLDEEPGPGGTAPQWLTSSPAGRALYAARADYRADTGLRSVPLAGGEGIRLDPPHARGPEQGSVRDYASAPDGAHVVYVADQEHLGHPDLYAVTSDGSAAPLKLHDAGAWSARSTAFRITSDGTRVAHLADPDVDYRWELFVAPLDGSAPAVPLGSGEGVWEDFALDGFAQHGFDTGVVFRREDGGSSALYRVPLDGGTPPTLLSGTLVPGGNVGTFALAPDDTAAVFLADAERDQVSELWSVPLAGGSRTRLSPALGSERDVSQFLITPDSAHVLFLADARVDGQFELYSVPLDGSAAALELDPAAGGSGLVQLFLATPDSSRAVFVARSDVSKLWSVPVDGSAPPVRLDGPLVAGGRVLGEPGSVLIDARLGRVLHLAYQASLAELELWSAPLDGSAPSLRCNDPLGAGVQSGYRSLALAPGGRHVLYVEVPSGPVPRMLTRTSSAGGGARLPLTAIDAGAPFVLDPFGLRALFLSRAGPFGSGNNQLFLVPTDASQAPRRLDVDSVPVHDVIDMGFAPDGRHALWLDRLPPPGYLLEAVTQLWSVPLPTRLRRAPGPPSFP